MCDCSLKSNNSVPSCNTPKSITLFLKLFVATISRYQNLLLKLKLKYLNPLTVVLLIHEWQYKSTSKALLIEADSATVCLLQLGCCPRGKHRRRPDTWGSTYEHLSFPYLPSVNKILVTYTFKSMVYYICNCSARWTSFLNTKQYSGD